MEIAKADNSFKNLALKEINRVVTRRLRLPRWLRVNARDMGSIPGREDPLEKGMVTHSRILAWRIPWTEDPGRLQSMSYKGSDVTEQNS